jgi:molybdenum cofactor sulfurtransferase
MIPAVRRGLEFISKIRGRKEHAVELSRLLFDRLKNLSYNGSSVIIHNRRGNDIIDFSISKNGKIINPGLFERSAISHGVYVRTGCFCNPGVNEKIFGSVDEFENQYSDEIMSGQAGRLKRLAESKPLGCIRVSFGYANDMHDVDRFAEFTEDFLKKLIREE